MAYLPFWESDIYSVERLNSGILISLKKFPKDSANFKISSEFFIIFFKASWLGIFEAADVVGEWVNDAAADNFDDFHSIFADLYARLSPLDIFW